MKFAPGLLTDEEQEAIRKAAAKQKAAQAPAEPKPAQQQKSVVVEKDRLFETVEKETGSERNYLKVLGVVVVLVLVVGGILFYFSLPSVGDKVKASKELEDAVRNHFLEKEKRTATDIDFYYCGSFHWARVNVETRTDIRDNPLAKVPTYIAKATPKGGDQFDITAAPMTSPDQDKPCQ